MEIAQSVPIALQNLGFFKKKKIRCSGVLLKSQCWEDRDRGTLGLTSRLAQPTWQAPGYFFLMNDALGKILEVVL